MSLITKLLQLLPAKTVYAHCDIPCGIYDPNRLQQAAYTVVRMTQFLSEAGGDPQKIARLMLVKEEHAEILKQEVRVLWGDYFKPEHLEKFPDLHDKVWNLLKLASKSKQETNMDTAKELLEKSLDFAEIFYKSKGLEPIRIKPPYPTEGEWVTTK